MLGYDHWIQQGPNLNKDGEIDSHAVPVLPERFELLGWGHLGVWFIMAALQRTATPELVWDNVMNLVETDNFSIYWDSEADEVAVVWRIQGPGLTNRLGNELLLRPGSEWQSLSDATEKEPLRIIDSADGEDLVLIATSGDSALEIATNGIGWMSLEEASEVWDIQYKTGATSALKRTPDQALPVLFKTLHPVVSKTF